MAGLFLCFGGGMVLGVVGPIVSTVGWRQRPLRPLGFRRDNWRAALGLGVGFAAVQFFLTLYGFPLPEPAGWVPLLVLALTVGLFGVEELSEAGLPGPVQARQHRSPEVCDVEEEIIDHALTR